MIVHHHDTSAFIQHATVGEAFKRFVGRPTASATAPEVVVLSAGPDAAGAFAYLGRRSWLQFVEFRPGLDEPAMIDASRQMLDWVFARGADSVFCVARSDNERWRSLLAAIEARAVGGDDGEWVFEISRGVH